MNITIKGTKIEVTDAIREYLEKRLNGLGKFVKTESIVMVELSKTTNHHKNGDIFKAEIRIGKGRDVYAVSEKSDLYSAIDDVRDEIMDIVSSQKDKKQSLRRKASSKIKKIIKS
jgi:putative sigma-54 modulation protein